MGEPFFQASATRSNAIDRDAQNRPRERVVLALLFVATAINYLDRQTLSIIAPLLRVQLGLTNLDYSRVIFLFFLGYTIGQALCGRLIDRVGTQFGLGLCMATWSVVSMLHGMAMGILSLGLLRLLLGVAEAGNWPGAVKAVSENIPPERRAFAVGVFNSGSTLGAIAAPPVVVLVVGMFGWRLMFLVVGLTGLGWLLFWMRHYRSSSTLPARLPTGSRVARPAFRSYFRKKVVWGLMIARSLADPTWWFYTFWLPDYLAQSRGFSLNRIGQTAWIPFFFAGIGGWAGGYVSDRLVRYGLPVVRARKVVMISSALLMLSGIPAFQTQTNIMALAWISVVLLAYSSWASNILSLPADLFESHEVAQITGISGTAGAIGGMLFTLLTGWLTHNVSFGAVFVVSSAMIVSAAAIILWLIPRGRLLPVPA